MAYDLRAVADARAGDGQLYNSEQIQPDEFYNCTWEGLRQTARCYGFAGYDDQQLRRVADNVLNRPPNHYGERWETNVAVASACWPELGAHMAVEYPADVSAALDAYGALGYRVHVGFWCDSAACVPAVGPVTYSHCCMNLWGDGGGHGFVNPEPHPDFYLTDDQIRSLYDGGGILVFKRSLLSPGGVFMALTDDEQEALSWRVEALIAGHPAVQGGPTKGEPNQLALGLQNFDALIWRVAAIVADLDTVPDGPTKGEVNQLKAQLEKILATASGAAPHPLKISLSGTAE